MKKLMLITLAIALLATVQAQDIKSLYNKHLGEGNYTTVTINGTFMKLMAEMSNDKEAKDVADTFDGIQICSADEFDGDDQKVKDLMEELHKLFNNEKYIEFMRVEDKNEEVVFYLHREQERIKEMVLLVDEDATIIRIMGDMTMSDLAKIGKTINVDGMENLDKIEDK